MHKHTIIYSGIISSYLPMMLCFTEHEQIQQYHMEKRNLYAAKASKEMYGYLQPALPVRNAMLQPEISPNHPQSSGSLASR